MAIDLSNDPPPATTVLRGVRKKRTVKSKNGTRRGSGIVTIVFGVMVFMSAWLVQFTVGGKVSVLVLELGLWIFLIGMLIHIVTIFWGIWQEVRK